MILKTEKKRNFNYPLNVNVKTNKKLNFITWSVTLTAQTVILMLQPRTMTYDIFYSYVSQPDFCLEQYNNKGLITFLFFFNKQQKLCNSTLQSKVLKLKLSLILFIL